MRLMITFLIIFSSCDMNKSDKNLKQEQIEIEAIKDNKIIGTMEI